MTARAVPGNIDRLVSLDGQRLSDRNEVGDVLGRGRELPLFDKFLIAGGGQGKRDANDHDGDHQLDHGESFVRTARLSHRTPSMWLIVMWQKCVTHMATDA